MAGAGGVHVAGGQSSLWLATIRIVVQEHLGGSLSAVRVLEGDVLAAPLYTIQGQPDASKELLTFADVVAVLD